MIKQCNGESHVRNDGNDARTYVLLFCGVADIEYAWAQGFDETSHGRRPLRPQTHCGCTMLFERRILTHKRMWGMDDEEHLAGTCVDGKPSPAVITRVVHAV